MTRDNPGDYMTTAADRAVGAALKDAKGQRIGEGAPAAPTPAATPNGQPAPEAGATSQPD